MSAVAPLDARERAPIAEVLRREAGLVFDRALEPRLTGATEQAARALGVARKDAIARAARGDRRRSARRRAHRVRIDPRDRARR